MNKNKISNSCIVLLPEGKKENGTERVFKEVMDKINLAKDPNLQIYITDQNQKKR